MINGFMYMTIATVDDEIKLHCGYDEKKEEYYMPSLTFTKTGQTWDNHLFIFETFLPFLRRWKDRSLQEGDIKFFEGLTETCFTKEETINEEWVDDLIEILEQGIKMGWDKLKY